MGQLEKHDYVSLLLQHANYQRLIQRLEMLENNRIYCHHDRKHFQEVADITLYVAEKLRIEYDETVVTLAAYLHDIGRIQEYEQGTSHETASVELAEELLQEISFPTEKSNQVLGLIRQHRGFEQEYFYCKEISELAKVLPQLSKQDCLNFIFAWADKRSRKCFECMATDRCKWQKQMKNEQPLKFI